MTALPTIYFPLYGRTILNDIGGICYGIASSSTYNITYRAFHRCQTVAPTEGYPDWYGIAWTYLFTHTSREQQGSIRHDGGCIGLFPYSAVVWIICLQGRGQFLFLLLAPHFSWPLQALQGGHIGNRWSQTCGSSKTETNQGLASAKLRKIIDELIEKSIILQVKWIFRT